MTVTLGLALGAVIGVLLGLLGGGGLGSRALPKIRAGFFPLTDLS